MKKIYITGVPGTGKSTVAKELNKRGIFTIDLDDVEGLCGWVYMDTKEKVPLSETINFETQSYTCDPTKLQKLLETDKDTAVVVGIAGNQEDFLSYFDTVFLLHCNVETFLNRLLTRTENNFGQKVNEQEFLRGFYKEFEENLHAQGAVPIDAEKPLTEVVDELVSKF